MGAPVAPRAVLPVPAAAEAGRHAVAQLIGVLIEAVVGSRGVVRRIGALIVVVAVAVPHAVAQRTA